MSALMHTALACALGAQVAAGGLSGPISRLTATGSRLAPLVFAAPAGTPAEARPAPSGSARPAADVQDPVVRALREEVEALRRAAAEAEAQAPDENARLKARLELVTQLLLVVIRQQERIYLQNQALLAGRTTPAPGGSPSPGAGASTPSGRPAGAPTRAGTAAAKLGPFFAKRGGESKVHRPGCPFGERISSDARVTFATLREALDAGYQPCKVCHPER